MVSITTMWEKAFEGIDGTYQFKDDVLKVPGSPAEIPIEETSLNNEGEEKLECPICIEPFDTSENAPHVLWCGHTLCKNCVMGLQRATMKFQKLQPIILPFSVSCPWCSFISLRLFYKGNLRFPSKNYFLLWMVDSENGHRGNGGRRGLASCPPCKPVSCVHNHGPSESDHDEMHAIFSRFNVNSLLVSLRKSLSCAFYTAAIFSLWFYAHNRRVLLYWPVCPHRSLCLLRLLDPSRILLPRVLFNGLGR